VAVVGPNANSIAALYANYNGIASNPVTVLNGIKQALGEGVEVNYFEGCPLVINELRDDDFEVVPGKYLFTYSDGKKEAGLKGEYFKGIDLTDEPVLVKTDKEINFIYEGASPTATELAQGIITTDQNLDAEFFSIRWTGKLVAPETGEYSIGLKTDDGGRIWINDELIAEDWSTHAMQAYLGKITLKKDETYTVKIEYYQAAQGAGVQLIWALPNKDAKDDNPMALSKKELAYIKGADLAIFVGGLDATWEGEEMGGRNYDGFNGGDRTKIELPAVQQKALKDMMKTGTPVVFVIMAGSAISFDGLEEDIPAMLLSWYPGQRGGNAVADVLFGAYNPAGRLPLTFYKSTNELADFKDYNMRAGKGFTYRYYQGEPLYPFGHGLSYTKFEYSDLKINQKRICPEDEFTVSVKVKNTGKLAGEEVVQLYVKDLESDTWMPLKQLRKFERIALAKGEEKTVEFTLKAEKDLRYYDAFRREYMVEAGEFEIQVGASSKDIRLKGNVTVE
jgi:beta-glucosidase